MLMEPIGQYNDLSESLRETIEKRIESFGDTVRYKFKIGNDNPDPEKYNGKIVYPRQFTLDPAKFTIRDEKEDRKGKSKIKNISIVTGLDEKGFPNSFGKIRLFGNEKGILILNLKKSEEDRAKCILLELHPKNENGLFRDENMFSIFSRIDEKAYAVQQRKEREIRKKALDLAFEMDENDILQFNSAMEWDEAVDKEVMRQNIESFAETEPDNFIKLAKSKAIEYRALVRSAISKGKLLFDPAEFKFTDNTTKQVVCVLSANTQKSHIELMAEWLESNGDKGEKVYNRLREMIK